MARYKGPRTRQGQWSFVIIVFSLLLAGGISLLVAFSGGEFNIVLFVVLLFSLLVVFMTIYVILSLPKVKGKIGETRVNRILKGFAKRYGGTMFHDVIVADEEGKTSQIDHIYVSTRGVYVIETKNYAGRIYGKDEQKEWTQVLAYGKVKNKLYNPVMQNRTHIYRLKTSLNTKVEMANVVVFVQGNVGFIESDSVYTLRGLKRLVSRAETHLDEAMIQPLIEAIQQRKERPISSAKEHVQQIKQRQKDIKEGICPRCGGKLVERTAKKDGRKFLGCENYPNCKFTKNIE